MNLQEKIDTFIKKPYPVWNEELCRLLVEKKQFELIQSGQITALQGYYSAAMLGYELKKEVRTAFLDNHALPIELPQNTLLGNIYQENGLHVLDAAEIHAIQASQKIDGAMDILSKAGSCGSSVSIIVKALQVLKEPAPEYDVSYSHPEIPFTIFVSVSAESSDISTLRLAESILHESMHLMLTLIESHIPLIEDNNQLFYSPWREIERPLRGVLHGIFVFRAVNQFYQALKHTITNTECLEFVEFRIEQIEEQIKHTNGLSLKRGLTTLGTQLVNSLQRELI